MAPAAGSAGKKEYVNIDKDVNLNNGIKSFLNFLFNRKLNRVSLTDETGTNNSSEE